MTDARVCQNCGASLDGLPKNARNCSEACREHWKRGLRRLKDGHRPLMMNGPFPAKICIVCGCAFEAKDRRQKYCKKGGSCAQRWWRSSEPGLQYFQRNDVHERIRSASAKYAETDRGKEMGAKRKRKEKRSRAASIHMQECINALPELQRMIEKMENANDK